MMMRRLLRLLGVRREIQRRLDVNLTFDDLEGDAGDVRNGARLALLSLRQWLDGMEEIDNLQVEPDQWSECSEKEAPYITDAEVGEECLCYIPDSDGWFFCKKAILVSRTMWVDRDGDHYWHCKVLYYGKPYGISSETPPN